MYDYTNSEYNQPNNGYESNDDLSSSGTNSKDLPIDPLWEKQQKKVSVFKFSSENYQTFTAWCNAHLRKVHMQIEDIGEDFRDGLKLMRLLEVISNESLPKPEKGKLRLHHVNNVNKALNFIVSKGVRLVSIGAEGMIWTIILRFAIQNISCEDISAKEGLLLWCQRQTKGYPNVNVQNFHNSFKDGLAFCALINKHRPELVDFSKLKAKNSTHNLNLAFEVAEEKLDIPKMLDAEDMATPDEKSVMAYVSSYYHCFSTGRQITVAAKRISKVLNMYRDNNTLKKDYELLSEQLILWITQKTVEFEKTQPKDSEAEVQKLMDAMRAYRKLEKPKKLEDKARLETSYNSLQTRLRLSNRQPYIPAAGFTILKIDALWKKLEVTEHSYELWLERELTRLKNLNHLLNKFKVKVKSHEAWANDKPEELIDMREILSSSQGELRAMTKRHEAFCSDLSARGARVERIKEISTELQSILGDAYREVGCPQSKEVREKTEILVEQWNRIVDLSEQRKVHIDKVLSILEQLDELHLEFAKKAGPFDIWMQQAEEDLQDNFIIRSADEVTGLKEAHEIFRSSLTEAKTDFEELKDLASQVVVIAESNSLAQCVSQNPYTHVTAEDLINHWKSVNDLEVSRTNLLEAAVNRQREISRLQEEFAQQAQILDGNIEERLKKCHSIGVKGNGTLEEQIDALQKLEAQTSFNFAEQFDALEKCDKALEDNFVFERSKTPLSLDQVRIKWSQLKNNLKTTINQIENQILTRDSKGLTQVQMDEYRKCFNHFDRDHTQRLEANEFKALLVSLEYSIAGDVKGTSITTINNNILSGKFDAGRRTSVYTSGGIYDPISGTVKTNLLMSMDPADADFARVLQSADPAGSGYVTFDSFVNFMTHEMSDQDSADQILESFRFLAGEKGIILEEDLRRDLAPEDANYCIEQMKALTGSSDGGNTPLDFQAFTKILYN